MAVQPLDLLPPVDVTFEDYALAVLRAEQIVNPTDPDGYRNMMIDVFVDRGILSEAKATELKKPVTVFDRLDVAVFHDPQSIAASRANAYRFLDDNRRDLFIPFAADVVVTDLSMAQKLTVAARRLPRQVLLQYIWREDVLLEGERFGRFEGQMTSMLCGGTLALDIDGNCLAWARKPGTLPLIKGPRKRRGRGRGGRSRQGPARRLPRCACRTHRGRPDRGQHCGRRGRPPGEVDCADDLAHGRRDRPLRALPAHRHPQRRRRRDGRTAVVDKLLIRAYNVGVGDCIYVRIPKARKKGSKVDDFHILIDCGKKGSADLLKVALDHLKTELPDEGGKKRLDLLLISHEHEDHIKGIDPAGSTTSRSRTCG